MAANRDPVLLNSFLSRLVLRFTGLYLFFGGDFADPHTHHTPLDPSRQILDTSLTKNERKVWGVGGGSLNSILGGGITSSRPLSRHTNCRGEGEGRGGMVGLAPMWRRRCPPPPSLPFPFLIFRCIRYLLGMLMADAYCEPKKRVVSTHLQFKVLACVTPGVARRMLFREMRRRAGLAWIRFPLPPHPPRVFL